MILQTLAEHESFIETLTDLKPVGADMKSKAQTLTKKPLGNSSPKNIYIYFFFKTLE